MIDLSSEPQDGLAAAIAQAAQVRLAPADLEQLRRHAERRTFPRGSVLFREGDSARTFFVLESGAVQVTQMRDSAGERQIAQLGPGDYFGEIAMIDKAPRTVTVMAIEDTIALEVSDEAFHRVLQHSPTLAFTMLHRANTMARTLMRKQLDELRAVNAELRQAYADLQAAQAELVRTERMKRDLEVAAQVQRSILPTEFPQVPGISIAARAQPAREMGGDFYEVFRLDDRHLGLLIADVSDKGVPAAMFMAVSQGLFLSEARRALSSQTVVLAVNDLLLDISSTDDMFVTAFYGVLDLENRQLTYVRAAQDMPILQHADGRQDILGGKGRFLGMLDGLQVEEHAVTLAAGDRLVLYSDGVPDAIDPAGQPYDTRRVRAFVAAHSHLGAEALADAILQDVLAHQGDAQQTDDITLLVAAFD